MTPHIPGVFQGWGSKNVGVDKRSHRAHACPCAERHGGMHSRRPQLLLALGQEALWQELGAAGPVLLRVLERVRREHQDGAPGVVHVGKWECQT